MRISWLSAEEIAAARDALRAGGASWDDVFFHLFLQKVEPKLGVERPTFLTEYPAAMASLSRLKPGDPSVAERVELYAGGFELANGFSELNDPDDQRRRFEEQRALAGAGDHEAQPYDEAYVQALEHGMPPTGGIGIGIDRLVMLLTGRRSIREVVLFPAMRD